MQEIVLRSVLEVLDRAKSQEHAERALDWLARQLSPSREGCERLSDLEPDRAAVESSSPQVDDLIDQGSQAALVISDEIRRRVRALVKKKFPPRSSFPGCGRSS